MHIKIIGSHRYDFNFGPCSQNVLCLLLVHLDVCALVCSKGVCTELNTAGFHIHPLEGESFLFGSLSLYTQYAKCTLIVFSS